MWAPGLPATVADGRPPNWPLTLDAILPRSERASGGVGANGSSHSKSELVPPKDRSTAELRAHNDSKTALCAAHSSEEQPCGVMRCATVSGEGLGATAGERTQGCFTTYFMKPSDKRSDGRSVDSVDV